MVFVQCSVIWAIRGSGRASQLGTEEPYQKTRHHRRHHLWPLKRYHVPCTRHDHQLCVWDAMGQFAAKFDRGHAISIAADHQGGGRDAIDLGRPLNVVSSDKIAIQHAGIHLAQPPSEEA